ncbi:purine-nucleoside phosphorylase [Spirochaeta isovalerica]|uniref:Uridine phosphorylase n=1 Tax=Spirochaeta isovalerica TaxID=150 RepID=A0A841RE25_9SPIO|nr:purine-nucleoside phosphorylase [Spirochaeta isovalerica]MBB6481467.1 purine-nucleoside phosphorylase [Spirochaeta isovalerica]
MSVHIGAEKGSIAETVLMPGDPLRARFIAEKFLENTECYNEVRGMYGYTGLYKGKAVSVQGSGMGQASLSIYTNELICDYGVKNLIRVGSCGSYHEHVKVRDLVIAMSASTDSAMNRERFNGNFYAPTADYHLFKTMTAQADEMGMTYHAGNILATDTFYHDDPEHWKKWADFGVLAVEMESAALYTLAAKHGARALTICTVSDNLATGEFTSSEERETSFTEMMKLALETAFKL